MSISCYSTKSVIEIIMAIIMMISIIGIFLRSIWITGQIKGIGARTIQFTCISLIIPCIIILGLENILKGETIATIIGGLIGYVLSGVGDFNNRNNPNN